MQTSHNLQQRHFTTTLVPGITALAALLGGGLLMLSAARFHNVNLPERATVSLDIAVFVHQLHVFIILLLSLCYAAFYRVVPAQLPLIVYTQLLFLLGTALFSGTIYLKYLLSFSVSGLFTVIGGAVLILTWFALAGVLFSLFRRLTHFTTS